ncbi:salicylyl-CoA 5-hydroxylase [Ktedonobacter sp. SOSP1-85]|uniref:oxidoreductase n=1 Tax=Ktedonobacter sp. SOSP1-85 TaxID=2778367 RepID=UPI0019159691|nr:FAD-dependent monooxygenase [Ktedonobacter sp. SOSP1-85]GHO80852.1 salicylyl-CoA 5-hydroxylase [Ktedonobacter sp. SOSP1-85]
MKIVILGGGPAGLYCGLLLKKAHPDYDITILERNQPDVTYGWGVVFSDRTLSSFQHADYPTYEQLTSGFVIWDAIDVYYRGETIRCGGHVIASVSRVFLLDILRQRCAELGVNLRFGYPVQDLELLAPYDLLIAADGINSVVRQAYVEHFKPKIESGKARYIWLGVDKVLDAFTFIFQENEHGLFQVHAYPSSGSSSTFIVECTEQTWLSAGLDQASEEESLAYCERLFADFLQGAPLLSNKSRWINFPTLKTRHWHHKNIVLLGDAAHTAHFSIGSGTKLAMEDAIKLAEALAGASDLESALNTYELERKPVVELFQRAAQESRVYFETLSRYMDLDPMTFAFQLLTRSGRVTYDDLRLRDTHFGDAIARHWVSQAQHTVLGDSACSSQGVEPLVAPPPLFTPFKVRDLLLTNRVVSQPGAPEEAEAGCPAPAYAELLEMAVASGAGLVLSEMVAVEAGGRIHPGSLGLYQRDHLEAWRAIVSAVHARPGAKIGLQLGHAGRRGATYPRSQGLDRPLSEGAWPLISASPIPYTGRSQVPEEMQQESMQRVCQAFVAATRMAQEAGFDLLTLNYAHGYLLASFLSPLTNKREDIYGGSLERRMRYPLELFETVRQAWPAEKPLAVSLSVGDCQKGGMEVDEAIQVARLLREQGCDLLIVEAGQTTPASELTYGRGFLTALSDRVRNEAGIPTLVGGYLTTSNEINTVLAAGRADLCLWHSE